MTFEEQHLQEQIDELTYLTLKTKNEIIESIKDDYIAQISFFRRKSMTKICRCIYCGRKFRTEESLKDHMIKFGTHV